MTAPPGLLRPAPRPRPRRPPLLLGAVRHQRRQLQQSVSRRQRRQVADTQLAVEHPGIGRSRSAKNLTQGIEQGRLQAVGTLAAVLAVGGTAGPVVEHLHAER